MKSISKIRFFLILTIGAIAFTFTSCTDSSEVIFSVSDSEEYQLTNPTVNIIPGDRSATVEINFAYPVVDNTTSGLVLKCKGYFYAPLQGMYRYDVVENAKLVSRTPTKYVYKLTDLTIEKEYTIYFAENIITYLLEDNFRFSTPVNLPQVVLGFETIYSSPIAVKGGLDNGWVGKNWTSVTDSNNQDYGGIGYAAYNSVFVNYQSNKTEWQWLISPKINLEAGREYRFIWHGRRLSDNWTDAPYIRVYITKSNNPDDIYPQYGEKQDTWLRSSYDTNSITFTPQTSGYYYCSFCLYQGYKPLLTGFEVKRIKH